MSRPFLEQRIHTAPDYGAAFGQEYAVINYDTASGNSYAKMLHPYPILTYDLAWTLRSQAFTTTEILDLYHKSGGTFGGFRLKDLADFTTNNYTQAPTDTDQILIFDAGNTYQMVRWYGSQNDFTQTRRLIRKPVDSTALVSISNAPCSRFNCDSTTGLVSISSSQWNVLGITLGATTQVSTNNSNPGFEVGEYVTFTGIGGTTELNGRRAQITNVSVGVITLDLDSSSFGVYTSGGKVRYSPHHSVGISNITFGAETTVTFSSDHELQVGDTRQFLDITGAPELNNAIGIITEVVNSTSVNININSQGATPYVSGGFLSEVVRGGCEFDVPVRFSANLSEASFASYDNLDISVPVMEVLNP